MSLKCLQNNTTQKLVAILIFTFTLSTIGGHNVSAAGWDAGRIIDDYVFTNSNTMSASQIQTFLNSKVSNCDTNGAQNSEYGGGTRAQWAANASLHPKLGAMYPPFTCLKDYSEEGLSSAQIIYNIAQQYKINPQVLIVLLQKEQGLVTDTWPLPYQYKTATGYGCPDTAPCDSQYYGLTNQLDWSAKMFRAIMNASPNWNTPYLVGNNYIRYNPTASCGGSNVTIQNRSTQALYNYTPYQPNSAAVAAQMGATVNCGAYGNINFSRYFNSWFGSTLNEGPVYAWSIVSQKAFIDSNYSQGLDYYPSVQPGQSLYVEIKARNVGNTVWDKGTNIATRQPTDRYSPFFDQQSWFNYARPTNLIESNVLVGGVGTFRYKMIAPQVLGTYNEHFSLVQEGASHFNDLGQTFSVSVTQPAETRNTYNTSLSKNKSLDPGQYIESPDENTILYMGEDGNLTLLNNFIPVWSSGTSGNPGARAIFQADGNLVVYNSTMKALWSTGTNNTDSNTLNVQVDGNVVLYKQSGGSSWNSRTAKAQDQRNTVVNQIFPGGVLYPGQRIETADRTRNLILQGDGNLVLYKNNKPLWSSGTNGKDTKFLVLQFDGNLVLYDRNLKPIWNSGSGGTQSTSLILQDDSNLVLYKATGGAQWATYTN